LFVLTGNGKGKTTGSLGMVVRAAGQGIKCSVLQFIKAAPEELGEYRTFRKLGIEWENYGCGFLWNQKDFGPTEELCKKGWESFRQKAESKDYGLIVLDEFTYVLSRGLLDCDMVVSYLSSHITEEGFPHVVITGRDAPSSLVEIADTVSRIDEVKHHFRANGGKTIRGIEF
ncbi:MAG: cob(I)yrinic acid a,c-diamide adenosyltransferase, partial [Spirochaetales bacterium]